VKNILEHALGRRGAQTRRWLTLRSLIDLGVVSVNKDFSLKNRTPPKSYTSFDNGWYSKTHSTGAVAEELFRSGAFPGFSGVHPIFVMCQFYYWTDGTYTDPRMHLNVDNGSAADYTFARNGGSSSETNMYDGDGAGTRTPCTMGFSFELGRLTELRGEQVPTKGLEFYIQLVADGSSSSDIEYGLIRWFITECENRVSFTDL
jgi:hypothetical protein